MEYRYSGQMEVDKWEDHVFSSIRTRRHLHWLVLVMKVKCFIWIGYKGRLMKTLKQIWSTSYGVKKGT